MSTCTQHDSPKKNCFISAVQSGQTIKDAAAVYDIPQQTTSDIWHKFQKTGLTHNLQQSGQPKKITPHVECVII
jgi:transposase